MLGRQRLQASNPSLTLLTTRVARPARARANVLQAPGNMQNLIEKASVLHEALPYIRRFHGRTFVIKYGG